MAVNKANKRKFLAPGGDPDAPIDISSDEDDDRPPKRQKSFTPTNNTTNGQSQSLNGRKQSRASPTRSSTLPKTSPPPQKPRITTPKKSPFKNIPVWSEQSPQKSKTITPELPSVSKIKFNPFPDNIGRQNGSRSTTGQPRDASSSVTFSPSTKSDQHIAEETEQLIQAFRKAPQSLETRSKPIKFQSTVTPKSSSTPQLTSKSGTQILNDAVLGRNTTNHSVRMPIRPSPSPSVQPLDQPHTKPLSKTKNIEIILPSPHKIVDDREQLMQELKKSSASAVERVDEVEKLFGRFGFSKEFGTAEDLVRMQKLAQPKKRIVDRSKVQLDLPVPPPRATSASSRKHDFTHPKEQVKEVLTARFRQQFNPPLTFVNEFNDRRLNGKFQFVDKYILRLGVKLADPNSNYGCECAGACDPRSCRCLAIDVTDNTDAGLKSEQIQTYTSLPDGLDVLCDSYIEKEIDPDSKHTEISECNAFCGCDADCWNRVVSNGRVVPLEIFETNRCGFGVRTPVNIAKGQFIELYLGEVITTRELEDRENAADEKAPSYIFSLDWFSTTDARYHIDGEYFGSAMRFVNHSCDPNSRTFTVQTHKEDKHVYNIAFFAIKDIPAGTEITVDYQPKHITRQEETITVIPYIPTDDADKIVARNTTSHDELRSRQSAGFSSRSSPLEVNSQFDTDSVTSTGMDVNDDDVVKCLCGAANCRGRLWAPGRKQRRRKRLLPRKD